MCHEIGENDMAYKFNISIIMIKILNYLACF